MSDTVGNMTMRVLRRTLQNPAKTAVSDNDDTALILDLLNEACMLLRDLNPTTQDADITLSVTSRLTDLPANIDFYEIYDWGWYYLSTDGQRHPLEKVKTEFIYENYPQFSTDVAPYPRFVYQDNNKIGIYPNLANPSTPLSMGFKYPALAIRRTQWSDLWPFPDNWLTWMERYAQYFYESTKGLGNPGATAAIMEKLYDQIFGKVARSKKVNFRGNRRIGRNRRFLRADTRGFSD
jgi:hypothetical protein